MKKKGNTTRRCINLPYTCARFPMVHAPSIAETCYLKFSDIADALHDTFPKLDGSAKLHFLWSMCTSRRRRSKLYSCELYPCYTTHRHPKDMLGMSQPGG